MKIEKKDGFIHEKIIVIPNSITDNNKKDNITQFLYVTDIGYFPNAKYHYRNRKEGCDNHILIYCVSGKGNIIFIDKILTLEQNSYIIIPKSVPHEYMADFLHPWSIYWLHFNGINSESYIELLKENRNQQLTSHQHGNFITAFHDIYSILENGYSRENMIQIANKLGLLFTKIRYSLATETYKGQRIRTVDRCIEHMLNNIHLRLSLDDFAKVANLSKSHLIHSFKEQTGYAPVDYFIHLKIQKACNLLDVTNLQIIEISNQLGYEDALYFSRIFKKTMDMSPKEYRKIQKG